MGRMTLYLDCPADNSCIRFTLLSTKRRFASGAFPARPYTSIEGSSVKDVAHKTGRVAQCFQPRTRCCSSARITISANLREHQETSRLARILRVPYSLHSNSHGPSQEQHACCFHSKTSHSRPCCNLCTSWYKILLSVTSPNCDKSALIAR